MNRIIKFRAWDKEKNAWYAPVFEAYDGKLEELLVNFSGQLVRRHLGGADHESIFPDRYELNRWTGLHDKNGKEIYEGDVTRINILDVGWVNCVVKHLEESGGYRHHKINQMQAVKACPGEGWSMLISDMFEVIGNIYENPELIK